MSYKLKNLDYEISKEMALQTKMNRKFKKKYLKILKSKDKFYYTFANKLATLVVRLSSAMWTFEELDYEMICLILDSSESNKCKLNYYRLEKTYNAKFSLSCDLDDQIYLEINCISQEIYFMLCIQKFSQSSIQSTISNFSTNDLNTVTEFLKCSIPCSFEEFEVSFNNKLGQGKHMSLSQYLFNIQNIRVLVKNGRKLVHEFTLSTTDFDEAKYNVLEMPR